MDLASFKITAVMITNHCVVHACLQCHLMVLQKEVDKLGNSLFHPSCNGFGVDSKRNSWKCMQMKLWPQFYYPSS